jgi:fructokinase
LIGKPLKEDLEKKLDKKISIENDANCFAISEATLGIAKNYSFVFGVILGTGVGGGIVIDGKIHHGRTNIAGEWGHHTLHQNGKNCFCGKKGCVETYISGPALEQRWKEMTGKNQSLPEIVKDSDNSKFITWKQEFLDNFGTSLANVIDILDPDVVVLGGGLSNIGFLYSDGIQNVYDKVFSDLVDTPILKNNLGDSAGVFGAALLN